MIGVLALLAVVGVLLTWVWWVGSGSSSEPDELSVFVSLSRSARVGGRLPLLVRVTPNRELQVTAVDVRFVAGGGGESVTKRLAENVPLRVGRPEEWSTHVALAPDLLASVEGEVEHAVEVSVTLASGRTWLRRYPVELAADPHAAPRVALGAPTAQPLCPYCRDDLKGVDPAELIACGGCHTVFHRECMEELGRCSTPGCAASETRAQQVRVRRRGRG